MIVVDSNIIGYLYLADERSAQVEEARHNDPDWAAPLLWRSELRNVLARYVRMQHLTLDRALEIMEDAHALMAGREYEVPSSHVLELAARSGCSAYDCEFVSLAQQLNVSLVTVDKQVLTRFPTVAVSLEKYLAAERR